MKKVVYWYKCRNCGRVFEGKEPIGGLSEPRPQSIHVNYGAHDTHKCDVFGKGVYGVGDLVGCTESKA